MSYTTQSEIIDKLPDYVVENLTDDDDGTTIDVGKIDSAIDDAQAVVDSYASAKYPVPFSSYPNTPRIITKTATCIAIYILFSRQGIDINGVDRTIEVNYKDCVKWLEGLRDGKNKLDVATPAVDSEVECSANERIFTRDTMRGF